MCYIYTMEYYSAIKNNEIMPFAATQMDLEIIIISEVRKRKTNTIRYRSHFIFQNLKNNVRESIYKTGIDIENKLKVTKGGGEDKVGVWD